MGDLMELTSTWVEVRGEDGPEPLMMVVLMVSLPGDTVAVAADGAAAVC